MSKRNTNLAATGKLNKANSKASDKRKKTKEKYHTGNNRSDFSRTHCCDDFTCICRPGIPDSDRFYERHASGR